MRRRAVVAVSKVGATQSRQPRRAPIGAKRPSEMAGIRLHCGITMNVIVNYMFYLLAGLGRLLGRRRYYH